MQPTTASNAGQYGSKLDSACKHILPCRVDLNLAKKVALDRAINKDADKVLQQFKMEYCMQQGQLVVSNTVSRVPKPYPLVHTFSRSEGKDTQGNPTSNPKKTRRETKFVGYALGLGYAHPVSGDTMASVLVGGLHTVQNGSEDLFHGDLLTFSDPEVIPNRGGSTKRFFPIRFDPAKHHPDEIIGRCIGQSRMHTSVDIQISRIGYHGKEQVREGYRLAERAIMV
jgi:hypothetical protein